MAFWRVQQKGEWKPHSFSGIEFVICQSSHVSLLKVIHNINFKTHIFCIGNYVSLVLGCKVCVGAEHLRIIGPLICSTFG